MSQRTEQVGSTIHRVVQDVLVRGLNDPRVRGLITVTGVEVAADLSEARVSITVLPRAQESLTLHGLRHARGHVQSRVDRALHLRRPPRLSFRLDTAARRQMEFEAAIAALRTGPAAPSAADDHPEGSAP
jgi:ribosome-binding factor A